MNTVELTQYSLGFAFEILSQVTADLTQEQADWKPPGVVDTIGAIYSHIVTYVDYFVQNYMIEGKPKPESIESRPEVSRISRQGQEQNSGLGVLSYTSGSIPQNRHYHW